MIFGRAARAAANRSLNNACANTVVRPKTYAVG
jgi:hypothetical protein